jgi:hypothetical protein
LVDARTVADILCRDECLEPVFQWIVGNMIASNNDRVRDGREPATIAALASYYPGITARSPMDQQAENDASVQAPFRIAQRALANTVRLALRLRPQYMRHAVVEGVCGTILDLCTCDECLQDPNRTLDGRDRDIVVKTDRATKIELLCDRLLGVVDLVDGSPGGSEADWAISLELEPGPTYVLNDKTALEMLVDRLTTNTKYQKLLPHVGVNLDVAHMKNAGVEARDLVGFRDWIVHAHICGHPGMHTRDQVVGLWSPVERYSGGDYPYMKLLAEIDPQSPARGGRPFTGTVALELEGCDRTGWIHRSLVAIAQMIEALKHHRDKIQQ